MTSSPTTPGADSHRGQPDQWTRSGRHLGHGHRHRLDRSHGCPLRLHLGTGITGVTATSLTVTAPAGTGTVDVTVTTPNGTSAVNAPSDQFTYNAPPPTVTAVSPTNGPQAGRQLGHGHRHRLHRGHSCRLRLHRGHRDHRVTATSLTVTAPAGTGTVDVTVTTPNGTSATSAE